MDLNSDAACNWIPPVLVLHSTVTAEIFRFVVSPSDQSWGSRTCDPWISADRRLRDTVYYAAWSNPKDIRRLWTAEFLEKTTLRTEDKHPWNFLHASYSRAMLDIAGHSCKGKDSPWQFMAKLTVNMLQKDLSSWISYLSWGLNPPEGDTPKSDKVLFQVF